jgi:CRP-like cAMP-binding protein
LSEPKNLLLKCLRREVFDALRPHLTHVKLSAGELLADTGREVAFVYFPDGGAVSLIVETSCGDTVETAMMGRDGAVNVLAALDHKTSISKAVVLLSGTAWAVHPDRLRDCAERYRDLRQLLARHVQVMLAEVQQTAACNIMDVMEARLARWLLRARDLADSDDLPLTQEAMAQMLGSRRPTVSLVAGTLQRAGMISHRRGHVRITDAEALEDSACECYATVREHYRKLLNA